jgi:spore cortex formation protein SpoVR/YcgB (stage V sporulation)
MLLPSRPLNVVIDVVNQELAALGHQVKGDWLLLLKLEEIYELCSRRNIGEAFNLWDWGSLYLKNDGRIFGDRAFSDIYEAVWNHSPIVCNQLNQALEW